jgi:hypothetical protein
VPGTGSGRTVFLPANRECPVENFAMTAKYLDSRSASVEIAPTLTFASSRHEGGNA